MMIPGLVSWGFVIWMGIAIVATYLIGQIVVELILRRFCKK